MSEAVLRRYKPEDQALIMQTWYHTLRKHGPRWMCSQPTLKSPRREEEYPYDSPGPGVTYMPSKFFDGTVKPRMARLLAEEGATIACSPNDKDLIYGFRIGPSRRTHLIFVKSQYRQFGIATQLCDAVRTPHLYTMSTPTERRLRKKGKIPTGWQYDPDGMWRNA